VRAKDVTEAVLRLPTAVSVSATQFFVAGLGHFIASVSSSLRWPSICGRRHCR
jgi:hypothetical protein